LSRVVERVCGGCGVVDVMMMVVVVKGEGQAVFDECEVGPVN